MADPATPIRLAAAALAVVTRERDEFAALVRKVADETQEEIRATYPPSACGSCRKLADAEAALGKAKADADLCAKSWEAEITANNALRARLKTVGPALFRIISLTDVSPTDETLEGRVLLAITQEAMNAVADLQK